MKLAAVQCTLLFMLLISCKPVLAFFNLTQYNMTLILADEPIMGQYVSGDWWLIGPVTIVGTEPAAIGGRNGFEVGARYRMRPGTVPYLQPNLTSCRCHRSRFISNPMIRERQGTTAHYFHSFLSL